jgi:hypothetical protein
LHLREPVADATANAEPERRMLTWSRSGRFVIDVSGIVRAVDVDPDPDYRYRPEPEKTVEEVRARK